ncbi:hypothetical protein [Kitasatospora sp. NPDC004289]
MSEISAEELLERIRKARGWARAMADHAEQEASQGPAAADPSSRFSGALVGLAYGAIAMALDEIVDPGTHTRDPG